MPKDLQGEFILNSPNTNPETPPQQTAAQPAAASSASQPIVTTNQAHTKPHFYSSLVLRPDGVVFQNQEADEEVILLIRRDFITNIPWIVSLFLLAFVPPVLFVLVPVFFPIISVAQPFIIISLFFYYFILFGFAVLYFAIWYFNVGLVTNKRVIDMDVANILVKETSEARLPAISDVTYTQIGGIQGFFDYGDVRVLTETYEQNLEFDRAPNPNMIRRVIGELIVNEGTT